VTTFAAITEFATGITAGSQPNEITTGSDSFFALP
jgi:hypothetical protein